MYRKSTIAACLLCVVVVSAACGEELSAVPSLESLDWIIGTWKSEPMPGPDGTPSTGKMTWQQELDGRFLSMRLVFEANGKSRNESLIVVGVDPTTKTVKAWQYNADGDVGEGKLFSNEDGTSLHWKGKGKSPNGQSGTAVIVYQRKGTDTFTIQFTKIEWDGNTLPDSPVMTMQRQPEKN